MSRHIQRTTRTAPVFPRLSVPQVAALAEATHGKREFTFKEAIQVAELFARDTEQTQAANAIADTLNAHRETLDEFTRAYIGAALWSSFDDQGDPLDGKFDIEDIADETIAKIAADCAQFQTNNARTLEAAYSEPSKNFTRERAGFCFWLNRNGHGSGYWDEEQLMPNAREVLNRAAVLSGPVDLYVGDDGKVHA